MALIKALLTTYISDFANYWHDYQIHGMKNVTQQKCLLVGYHSRCTVDNLYLWCRINANFLISHVFFSIPGVGRIVKDLGAIPSKGLISSTSDETFSEFLSSGDRPMLLLPGGAFEATKSWDKKFIVDWKDRPGFARIIGASKELRESIRVVPFFTRNSEDIFYNFEWWFNFSGRYVQTGLSDAYKGHLWKLPFVLTVGIYSFGISFLPRPVKLDTYFGEPLMYRDGESIEEFAERVRSSLQELINRENSKPAIPLRNSSVVGIPYAIFKGFLVATQLTLFQLSNVAFFFTVAPLGIAMAYIVGGLKRV